MTTAEQLELNNLADVEYEIFPLLKTRYSPRIFSDALLPEVEIMKLFEAARWAASSYNRQPWRFVYCQRKSSAYATLLDCLSTFNQAWASNAPLLIITIFKEKTADGKDNFHALHDLGLAMGNMTIQAQSANIALHHMAGVDIEKVKDAFQIPEGFHINSVVAAGYYGGDPNTLSEDLKKEEKASRDRRPVVEFAFENEWKNLK
ncbi:nitroreductase family protein [Sungkyunkwania multivorans]|uniref:Nitroreductase family protein n=1 Tax=Sungkyunkwania multivorans TaxID=1173618 RepID=A0ABW3CTV5_9FLAO